MDGICHFNNSCFMGDIPLGAMNMAYGFKQYPLNGPFPQVFSVIKAGKALSIEYDKPFIYRNNTENSGFFYCCGLDINCESSNYTWPVLPKHVITPYQDELRIEVEISFTLCPLQKGFPFWVGYAFENAPFKIDFGGNIYGRNDMFQTPAATWR